MAAQYGGELLQVERSAKQLREAIIDASYRLKTGYGGLREERVLTSAHPRRFAIRQGSRKILELQRAHRAFWTVPQRIYVADTPSFEQIKFGVTISNELVVKYPVARDINGDAVLVRRRSGLTEMLGTWQIYSAKLLSPQGQDYLARCIRRTAILY